MARNHFASALSAAALAVVLLAMVSAPRAEAAFPGTNGRIVFESNQETAGGTAGDTDVFTMNPDGTDMTQLTGGNNLAYDVDPAWSPDGRKVAFVRQDGIYVMEAGGSDQRRLYAGITEPGNAKPAWSPEGSRIAFGCVIDAGNRDICTVNADGSGLARITSHPKDDMEPAFSPDGRKIAFSSTRDEAPTTQNFDIFVMNSDGTDPTNITRRPGNDISPDWSPNGTRIAFASHWSASGFYADREIWAINADGTNPAKLTDDSAGPGFAAASHPAYSPDGTKIAYESPLAGNHEIYVMNAAGSGHTRITTNSVYDDNPDWQPLNADLSLTKTGSPDTVTTGHDLTYTLTTTNNGPATAKNALLTDPLPASTTFVSASSGCSETGGTVTCNLGDIANGASATTTIAVRPAASAPSSIDNSASVSSDTRDAVPANNSASDQTAINRPPDAADDAATTSEDNPVTVNVLSNDTDPDGDPRSLTASTQPSGGSASCTSAGDCTFTPAAGFNGAESFTYTVSDDRGGTDTATVSITVNGVNDPPAADDEVATTDEDTPVDITLAATDAEGDALTYTIVSGPQHGTLSGTGATRTYVPDPDYNGPDSFAFKANDGAADSNTATVVITVNPVNDAPAITGLLPSPGSTTRDRTPTLEATVRDAETELTASHISLHLDDQPRAFSYDQLTDRLSFTPSIKLSFGSHTVRVEARDGDGLVASETWSFRVARRR